MSTEPIDAWEVSESSGVSARLVNRVLLDLVDRGELEAGNVALWGRSGMLDNRAYRCLESPHSDKFKHDR